MSRRNRYWGHKKKKSGLNNRNSSRSQEEHYFSSRSSRRSNKRPSSLIRSFLFNVFVLFVVLIIFGVIYLVFVSGRFDFKKIVSPPSFQDDCQNSFYPLASGSEIIYGRVLQNEIIDTFSIKTVDRQDDDYTQKLKAAGRVETLPLRCNEKQLIAGAYLDWAGVLGESLRIYPAPTVVGERIPRYLIPGSHWLVEYTLSNADEMTEVWPEVSTVVINNVFHAVSFEKLTAPFGELWVMRVKVTEKINYLDKLGKKVSEPLIHEYYEYWNEGRGLVRIHAPKVRDWDYVITEASE